MKTKILMTIFLILGIWANSQTVKIGSQEWDVMNCQEGDGVYYRINGNVVNKDLGKLYTQSQLNLGINIENPNQGPCKDGFHVPDSLEWQTLFDFLGGTTAAWKALKEVGYNTWYCGYTYTGYTPAQKAALDNFYGGTDLYGFDMKGTGYSPNVEWFTGITKNTYFWTSSMRVTKGKSSVSYLLYYYFSFYPVIQKYPAEKDRRAFPVRCIKNAEKK